MSSAVSDGRKGAIWSELARGWPTLLACVIGLALGASILPYIAGVFVQSFQTDFGWTRSQLSAMSLVIIVTVIPLAPVAGWIVDRFGVRIAVSIGMGALVAGYVAFAYMSGSFIEYLVIYLVVGALALLSTSISFTRAINERFVEARGLALGLALSGTGIAAAIAPSAMAAIIAEAGWRVAYLRLAGVTAVAIPIIVLLLGRHDGERHAGAAAQSAAVAAPHAKLAIRAIVSDRLLLRLCATFFVLTMGVAGFGFHFIPMMMDRGMSQLSAAGLQAGLGIGLIAGRLVVGAVVDHFFAPFVAALALCFSVLGIIGLAVVGPPIAGIAVFAIGFSLGAEGDLIGYLTARYFGMDNYGQRYGVIFSSYLLANGASPLLMALVAAQGGYQPALWMSAAFIAVAIGLFLTLPRFVRGERRPALA